MDFLRINQFNSLKVKAALKKANISKNQRPVKLPLAVSEFKSNWKQNQIFRHLMHDLQFIFSPQFEFRKIISHLVEVLLDKKN